MTLLLSLRLLHILSAMVMIGGIFARQALRRLAESGDDVRKFAALTEGAHRIERLMVIPGSMAVIVLGVILALATGAPILGFLQGQEQNWLLASNLLIISILLIIPTVFLPHRRRLEHALKLASQQGHMTSELRTVIATRRVRLWHIYEQVAVVAVVALMALKPF
jgi:uncharacterized membrane protein